MALGLLSLTRYSRVPGREPDLSGATEDWCCSGGQVSAGENMTSDHRVLPTRRARPSRNRLPLRLTVLMALIWMLLATGCGINPNKTPAGDPRPAETLPTPATPTVGPRQTAHSGPLMGVFRNTSVDRVREFEAWLGSPVDLVVDYASAQNWDQIANPNYLLEEWQDQPYRLVYAVPMLPSEEPATFAEGAAGAYDGYFRELAQRMVASGHGDSILRIGLEFNVSGSPYAGASPGEYIAFWRRIVAAMRDVPGQSFLMDWNPGNGSQAGDGPAYYPGNDVVDVVGVDVYDLTGRSRAYPYPPNCDQNCRQARQDLAWNKEVYGSARGLKFWSGFAREHGKPMSLPEWGLWNRPDGTGGGENPSFIRRMHEFINDPANNVMYHAYFEFNGEQGQHSLMETFQDGGAIFRERFG